MFSVLWKPLKNTYRSIVSNPSKVLPRLQKALYSNSRDVKVDESILPEHLIALKPREPQPEECCGDGCSVCVTDIYEQELKIWKKECHDYFNSKNDLSSDKEPVISTSKYTKFVLQAIYPYTLNCCTYRFEFSPDKSLDFKVGQHLIMRGVVNGKSIVREYTPVSPPNAKGYFDVLIKVYFDGKMSEYIRQWEAGTTVEWRGPQGEFTYKPNSFRHMYLIAAGTGITPMIQVMRTVLENENDETRLHLLYSCRYYTEVLLQSIITKYKCFWNCKVAYFLTRDNKASSHYGLDIEYNRINKATLEERLCDLDNIMILICGTQSFNADMKKYLRELSVPENKYFVF